MTSYVGTAPKSQHKYVLSIPLTHNKHYGVITIHSSSDFSEEEVALLEKLSSNIAFALSAYEVSEDRRRVVEQLAMNLTQFDEAADRLRNPLAAIIGAVEVKDMLGSERALQIIGEHARRIKEELDKRT